MNAITQDHIDDQTLDGTNLFFDATGTPLGVTFIRGRLSGSRDVARGLQQRRVRQLGQSGRRRPIV